VTPSARARSSLARVFDPGSIAVVGASSDPAKRGYQIVRALTESGYGGRIHPVNPRGGELLGLPVAESVERLPDGVDLAVLCTPAEMAPDLVRACGARGVGGVVVLAVGFAEVGGSGEALEDRLADAGEASGVRIIGPNTSGLLNLGSGVNLVGARDVRSGGLAVLVQSGNMALALMTEVTERSWDGISIYLGVGNQVDLGFAEALEYLETHDETHAVIAYVEGLRDPAAFLSAANRVGRSKPVVLLKSGRTVRGAEAARSHTGAVAGPYDRLHAGFAQAGVVELRRADELLHVAETLGRQPPPDAGRGVAILSDGGGQGTLAVDWLTEAGARLSPLSASTRADLRTLLGRAAAVANPVDLAGAADSDPEIFGRAVEILVADPAVGTVLVIGLFGGYAIRFADSLADGEARAAQAMAARAREAGRGLVVHTMYAAHRSPPLEILGRAGVPVVGSLEVACRCIAELQRRGAWLERRPWPYDDRASGSGAGGVVTAHASHPAIDRALDEARGALTEPEARAVLADVGLEFGPWSVADSAAAVVEAFRALGGSVVVKLVSADILHKSDAGGVVVGVTSEEDARGAYTAIRDGARRHAARHGLGEVSALRTLVAPHLDTPRAELLVGGYRDPDLGPVLTLGAGGVWVEALGDAAVRVLPVDDRDLEDMLAELRVAALLAGGRGFGPVRRQPIFAVARAVAEVMARWPRVAEVELNPLFVYEERAIPVDARIVLAEER